VEKNGRRVDSSTIEVEEDRHRRERFTSPRLNESAEGEITVEVCQSGSGLQRSTKSLLGELGKVLSGRGRRLER